MGNKQTKEDLKIMQSWPLERKIRVTQTRIIEWYLRWQGMVYVSFSGGKDSTVLLDLARRAYPDIEAVFVDTGLEYPEIRQFVETKENVTWLHPIKYDRKQRKYVRTNFREVIKKYGYPVISKEVSRRVYDVKKNGTKSYAYKMFEGKYLDKNGEKSVYNIERWKFLIDSPFGISHYCCNIMKKAPAHDYGRKSGKYPMTGQMACESLQRKNQWTKNGCNGFSMKSPISNPMSFWTEQDVLQYLKITGIPYCSVYGDIVASDGVYDYDTTLIPTKLHCTGCQRTGCMFCMFGVHLEKEPNRFQRMKITHPKQYAYCINKLGIGAVLDYIGVPYN